MNAKKAKLLRREIYHSNAQRPTVYVKTREGQVLCSGLRLRYLALKKLVKSLKGAHENSQL